MRVVAGDDLRHSSSDIRGNIVLQYKDVIGFSSTSGIHPNISGLSEPASLPAHPLPLLPIRCQIAFSAIRWRTSFSRTSRRSANRFMTPPGLCPMEQWSLQKSRAAWRPLLPMQKYFSLRKPAPFMVYQIADPEVASKRIVLFNTLIVRGRSTDTAVPAVRTAARDILPPGADLTVRTFHQLVDQDLSRERMLVSLSGAFATLALLLTVLGLYGLLMRSVSLRTRVHQFLQEPYTLGGLDMLVSGLLVLLIVVLAAVVPAHCALRIEPIDALRAE